MLRFWLFSLALSLCVQVSREECSKIKDKLDDNSIEYGGPYNDVCILDTASCCDKAVEQKLLAKTKETLKNMVFLVLNQFYQKMDVDKSNTQANLTSLIKAASLPHSAKVELQGKFSSYVTGVNSLTAADLDSIKSAAAIGSLTAALGADISDTCQEQLFYDLDPLKDAEHKYLSSILLTLRGYEILTGIITNIQRPALTEECYIGAVRGGLKFGGCELCLDTTAFAGPCVKLCRNILSGCLKGHIEARDTIQSLAKYQIKLAALTARLYQDRNTALDALTEAVKNKLRVDQEFHDSCGNLQTNTDRTNAPYYNKLSYEEVDARHSLDSSWLCTYVFGGVSEVNCWNRTSVGQYHNNVYEFTEDGQFQNPEVVGDGPVVDISEYVEQFTEHKNEVDELTTGRDVLKPNSALSRHCSVLLSVVILLLRTILSDLF